MGKTALPDLVQLHECWAATLWYKICHELFFFLRRKGRGRKRPEYFTTIVCHTKKHRREQQLLVTTEKFVRWVFANQCNRTVCSNLLDSKEEKIFQCFHLKDAWYLYQHYSLLSPSAQRLPT